MTTNPAVTVKIGERQLDLYLYRHLVQVNPDDIKPFGRALDPAADTDDICVVGRDLRNGTLVKSAAQNQDRCYDDWSSLPLVVMGGFR